MNRNYTDIRVYHEPDSSGTCQLTDKKRAFVFPVEVPLGSPTLIVCDAALQQEVRKAVLLGSGPKSGVSRHENVDQGVSMCVNESQSEVVATSTSQSKSRSRGTAASKAS